MLPFDPAAVTALIRQTAAAVIMPRFRTLTPDQMREKKPGDIVTIADTESEVMLCDGLAALVPDALFCGEEAVSKDPSLLDTLESDRPAWIIDPVDGTWNFARGRPAFAVIVAFVQAGRVRAGWIHQPVLDTTVTAIEGQGTWLGARRLRIQDAKPLCHQRGAAYGCIGGKAMVEVLQPGPPNRPGELAASGSAGVDYVHLATGEIKFQLSTFALPWDHAAGSLIVTEAGGTARFLDGTPYSPRRRQPILSAAGEETWAAVQACLGATGAVVAP